MSAQFEPNPPSRRHEDFPKTTTIPEGWMTDGIMATYNTEGPVYDPGDPPAPAETQPLPAPTTAKTAEAPRNGRTRESTSPAQPAAFDGESPFHRQLNPFPSEQALIGMWL